MSTSLNRRFGFLPILSNAWVFFLFIAFPITGIVWSLIVLASAGKSVMQKCNLAVSYSSVLDSSAQVRNDRSAPKKNWCRSVRTLRHQLFGAELSWCRSVLVPKCPDTLIITNGRRSTRHRVDSSQVNSSPGRLVTRSTHHKEAVNSSQRGGQLVTSKHQSRSAAAV